MKMLHHHHQGGCGSACVCTCGRMLIVCRYIASLYWTFTTISTTGYGDIVPTTIAERSYSMGAMLLGLTVFSYFISAVSQAVEMINAASLRSKEQRRVRARTLLPCARAYNTRDHLGHPASTLHSPDKHRSSTACELSARLRHTAQLDRLFPATF